MLSIIVAMTEERVIGRNNQLPWHLAEDLRRFKKITMGHPIIMGRKTFDSIGKPLPGRQNIVITRDPEFRADGVTVGRSLLEAFGLCDASTGEEFVIGGASVFAAALPLAQRLYLTLIHKDFPGDVFFPAFDLKNDYRFLDELHAASPAPDSISYSFIIAEKIAKSV
jgi:dihydrofolate reductase